jgi:polyferredoxin
MASKRALKSVEIQGQEEEPDESWRTWFLGTYAKYWFFILCLFVDSMIGLQVFLSLDGLLGIVVTMVALAILILFEVLVYRRYWGEDGKWALSED